MAAGNNGDGKGDGGWKRDAMLWKERDGKFIIG
jgi:hypothetical protein